MAVPCRCFFSFGFGAPATPLALPSRPRSHKNTYFFHAPAITTSTL
nr:MAG TPA: hypothetical protein [Caudoviricetes sp.]